MKCELKYERHLGQVKETESNYVYCTESVVDLLNAYEIERKQLRGRIEELESDFAGYQNFERERRLERITQETEEENKTLRAFVKGIATLSDVDAKKEPIVWFANICLKAKQLLKELQEEKKKSRLLKTFREWQKSDYEELDLLRTFIITKDLEEEFDKWVSERLEDEET